MAGTQPDKREVIDNINTKKSGLVTIAVHKMSDDLAKGTLNSILKQTQLKKED